MDHDMVSDIFKKIILEHGDIKNIKEELQKQLSEVDKDIQTCLYRIEFEKNKHVVDGYSMYLDLRDKTRRRRRVKRQLYKANFLINAVPNNQSISKLKHRYIDDEVLVDKFEK